MSMSKTANQDINHAGQIAGTGILGLLETYRDAPLTDQWAYRMGLLGVDE